MRVRNNKNHIFEKRTTTNTFGIFLWYLLFSPIIIGLPICVVIMYIVVWNIVWVMLLWVVTIGVMRLIHYIIHLHKEKQFIKLKKWRKHNFLEKLLTDINAVNHQNYLKSSILHKSFLKQLFIWRFLFFLFMMLWPICILITLLHEFISVWKINIELLVILLYTGIPLGVVMFYIIYWDYIKIRKILKKWYWVLLRSKIKSYYKEKNKVFFY